MKLLFAPVAAVASCATTILLPLPAQAQSPEDLRILSGTDRGLSFAVQMRGPVERTVSAQSSENLTDWIPGGDADEIIRGFYQFVDSDAIDTPRRFYRFLDEGPVVNGAWADHYPVTPLDFEAAGVTPHFAWQPYPAQPPIDYELNVYEFEYGSGGRLVMPSAPILTVGGIIETEYAWGGGDPDLNPNHLYAYTVTGNLLGFQDIGAAVFFVPFGGDSVVQPTDWAKRMELIKLLLEELDTLDEELGDNPLIQEIQLIDKLVSILSDYDLFKDFLISILNSEIDKLIDKALSVETAKKILCFLEDSAEIIALDHAEGSKKRMALDAFKNGVGELKQAIEDGETVTDIWGRLEELVDTLQIVITDPGQFLLDAAKDKFTDKLRSILVRKVGEAAAGSLISIAINLAVFADALLTLSDLEATILEVNRLLLSGVENSGSRDVFNPEGTFVFPLQPGQEDCDITIAFKKICFTPTPDPGDAEHAGTWGTPTSVAFAGSPPAASKTMMGGDYPTTFAFGINKPYKFCDTPKVPVPCSAGPCIVFTEVTITCPGKPPRKHRIFAGVVKQCP